jgi:hypothetical protein
MYIYMV